MTDTGKLVSVVIPTVGESTLGSVIDALNSASIIPAEIIVVIPIEYQHRLDFSKSPNVVILPVTAKGQVRQRVEGFKAAKYEYVLQLDSDILVEAQTLSILVDSLDLLGSNSAVCPMFDNAEFQCQPTTNINIRRISRTLLNYLLDSRSIIPDGVITKAGIETWPPFTSGNFPVQNSEWLPGGCVLHFNANLILYDFYPFEGKALGEDVIHSILLRKNKVSLHICKAARVVNTGAFQPPYKSLAEIFEYVKKITKVRLLVLKINGGSKSRLLAWTCLSLIATLLKFVKRSVFNK